MVHHAARTTRHALRTTHHAPCAMRHAPCAMRHTPHTTHHTPCVTRHVLPRAQALCDIGFIDEPKEVNFELVRKLPTTVTQEVVSSIRCRAPVIQMGCSNRAVLRPSILG